MATQSQTPGNLNLSVKRGDDYTAVVDFDIDLTGFSVTSSMSSLVSDSVLSTVSTSISNAPLGQVVITIPKQQTSAMSPGSYGWTMRWSTPAGGERAILGGILEVIR